MCELIPVDKIQKEFLKEIKGGFQLTFKTEIDFLDFPFCGEKVTMDFYVCKGYQAGMIGGKNGFRT
jgi:hypothetical protein